MPPAPAAAAVPAPPAAGITTEQIQKETADHLLYPNPGSGLVHELHPQYFHFLGSLLGKAYVVVGGYGGYKTRWALFLV